MEVDGRRQGHVSRVHAQDRLAPPDVGLVDHHLAVEAPRSEQGGIEHLRTVGRRHDDHALGGVEAVHLREELVQRLLALVVPGQEPRRSRSGLADGVELVDEDDAGGLFLGLLEEVPHAGRPDAHEHLDELGARQEEERDIGLAGHRARQKRLAGAGRADQQHAFGNAATEPLVLLGVREEIDHLEELGLGLVHAGHVRERRLQLLPIVDLGLGAAEGQGLRRAAADPPHEEDPERRHDPEGSTQPKMRSRRNVLSIPPRTPPWPPRAP